MLFEAQFHSISKAPVGSHNGHVSSVEFKLFADAIALNSSSTHWYLHIANEDVHQSRFACSRRSEDGCQLPRSKFATNCLKNSASTCSKQNHNYE
jgi:hypothetical protein